ncbi:MAG TPA: hypothetical protein VN637_10320, partial [Roseiarcus sp.]|nr:hypothetical protein [Roseiarcus sp.]
MRIIRNYGFVLALALAVVYAYAPLRLEDLAKIRWLDDISALANKSFVSRREASLSPIDPVAAANVDEDLDYRIAQHANSAEGWRSFLAAHPHGPHAQSARAELGRLVPPGQAPATAVALASNGRPPGSNGLIEAALPTRPSPPTEVAAHPDGGHAQSARAELDRLVPPERTPAAVAAASNAGSADAKALSEAAVPARPSPPSEVARPTPDELCKRDEDRLQHLSESPTGDEAMQLVNELRCEKLRPELSRLTEHLDYRDSGAAESRSSRVAERGAANRQAAEPRDRPRWRTASRRHEPRRWARRRAAPGLPPILMALFGEKPRASTEFRRFRAGGGGGGGSSGVGATGGAASAASASA